MAKYFDGLGIGFSSSISIADALSFIRIAEEEGLRTAWLGESYHARSTVPIAAAALTQTRRIRIGLGIISPYTRHPATIAMETAALDELSSGRLILGLGAVARAISIHKLDVAKDRPVRTHRECVEIIRRLLSGERFTYEGKVFKVAQPISGPTAASKVPIYIGATGDGMLRLAGQVGDGLLLTYQGSPDFVRHAVAEMKEGAKATGRVPEEIDVQAYFLLSVDEDAEAAELPVRQFLTTFIPRLNPAMTKFSGLDQSYIQPILDTLSRGEARGAMELMDRRILDNLSISGTSEDCIRRLKAYLNTGLRGVIPYHIFGPNKEKSLRIIARDIAPALTGG